MITFLFWNLYRKPLQGLIANLAQQHNIDVFMFVENTIPPAELLYLLNPDPIPLYHYVPKINCEKVEIFTKFPKEFIPAVYEESRLTIRNLKLPGQIDILLAIIHSQSKSNWSNESQSSNCAELSSTIKKIESIIGHSRTVFVGDFNMDPFEQGVVSAMGLHGVMSRNIAQKSTRKITDKEYMFFYNPMWNFFGDKNLCPGTYYYNNSEPVNYFWHIFDQRLIRPDLLDQFDTNNLQILTSDGSISFLNEHGLPDKNLVSDHLPILFKLNI